MQNSKIKGPYYLSEIASLAEATFEGFANYSSIKPEPFILLFELIKMLMRFREYSQL